MIKTNKVGEFLRWAVVTMVIAMTMAASGATWAQAQTWAQIVSAAEAEGKLVISGAPSQLWRDALAAPFEKKYPKIKLQYVGLNGTDFWARVLKEREVGQHLWDLRVGGANPQVYRVKDQGVLAPVRPLVLPEVAADGKWAGGFDGIFTDREKKFIPGFLGYTSSLVEVNREFVPEAQLSAPQQLLDPRFKGKIVILDPHGGSGLGNLGVLLADQGEAFLRTLLTQQQVVVTKDMRQLTEWMVRGRYPIGLGMEKATLLMFQKQKLGLRIKGLEQGKVPLSMGFGAIQLLSKAPHPNAARVYINWLLSQEAQMQLVKKLELNSRRLDVPPGDPATVIDVKRLDRYVAHQTEEFLVTRKKAQELAKELIK